MTRRELLDSLRARGLDVKPHTVAVAIDYGRITRPQRDGSGNYIYTDAHCEALAAILEGKREAATA